MWWMVGGLLWLAVAGAAVAIVASRSARADVVLYALAGVGCAGIAGAAAMAGLVEARDTRLSLTQTQMQTQARGQPQFQPPSPSASAAVTTHTPQGVNAVFDVVREVQLVLAYLQASGSQVPVVFALSADHRAVWVVGNRSALRAYLVSALAGVLVELAPNSLVRVVLQCGDAAMDNPVATSSTVISPEGSHGSSSHGGSSQEDRKPRSSSSRHMDRGPGSNRHSHRSHHSHHHRPTLSLEETPCSHTPVRIHVTYPGETTTADQSMLQVAIPILSQPGDLFASMTSPPRRRLLSVSKGSGLGMALPPPGQELPIDIPKVVLGALLVQKNTADTERASVLSATITSDAKTRTSTLTMTLACRPVPCIVVLEPNTTTVREISGALHGAAIVGMATVAAAGAMLTPAFLQTVTHVFLSVLLPDGDGRDVCRLLRRMGFQGVLVALVDTWAGAEDDRGDSAATPAVSAAAETDTPVHFRDAGFDFVLRKRPINRTALLGIINVTAPVCSLHEDVHAF
jgi:CheY-like chemotaxis protein